MLKRTILLISLMTFMSPAFALTDLVKVYQQALVSDPTYQKAVAQYQADVEATPQAVSALLPQLSANGSFAGNWNKNHKHNNSLPHGTQRFVDSEYGLALSQTLIDFNQFFSVSSANASVKAAVATLDAAQQDLMQRVVNAYFNVLEAQDTLRYDLSEKRANYRQLDQAQQKYRVGLSAVTDVYNAQANYDASLAQVIADKNAIDDAREDLRAITNIYYSDLAPLRGRLPLVKPKPTNINKWVDVATQQNFALRAARYLADAASADVNQARSGHLPTVSLTANSARSHSGFNGTQSLDSTDSNIGVALSLPIFQGGLVMSETRQAIAEYHVALANQEQQYRQTMNDTRQNYNNVMAGISKINADRQFIRSAQSSLKTNEESFKVGTRTIIDVLDSVTILTQAQQQHAQDQYAYLLDTIALKQAAGTLSMADLGAINQWLIHSETAAKKAAQPVDDQKPLPSLPKSSQKNKPTSTKKTVPTPKAPTTKPKQQPVNQSKAPAPPQPKMAKNKSSDLQAHALL